MYIDKLDNIVNKYKHTYHIDDDQEEKSSPACVTKKALKCVTDRLQ